MRELSAEGVDTCFLKGKNSLINAACPYREGSLAEHWWTRGFAYSELERVVSSNAETECGQREWVGMTEDEVYRIAVTLEGEHWKKIADAIEAKLKEKNT